MRGELDDGVIIQVGCVGEARTRLVAMDLKGNGHTLESTGNKIYRWTRNGD